MNKLNRPPFQVPPTSASPQLNGKAKGVKYFCLI